MSGAAAAAKKEIEPIREILETIVAPHQRSSIHIIPEHVTIFRGQKSKKQLTKKKSKKKSTLTRKEFKELGIYTLPTKSIKYEDMLPMHTLWEGYFREHLSLDEDETLKIPQVFDSNYDAFSKSLIKLDLTGSILTVVKSKCPNFVGLSGIVVMDTKNTLKLVGIDNKLRTIPKQECIFNMKFENIIFTLFGKHLRVRPAEKSVKKMKNYIEPNL